MNCPRCGVDGFSMDTEEVDIGVGSLVHIMGGKCGVCGPLAVRGCGAWDGEHFEFCRGDWDGNPV